MTVEYYGSDSARREPYTSAYNSSARNAAARAAPPDSTAR
jgi:hypothetical protein